MLFRGTIIVMYVNVLPRVHNRERGGECPTVQYRKRGNFHWAKLLRYPQYMDFHGNTFAVQGQGPIYVYLKQKFIGKTFALL